MKRIGVALPLIVALVSCGGETVVPPQASTPVAVLSNVPTDEATVTIMVGGPDVYAYQFSVDGAPYSGAVLAASPLVVHDLSAGPHTIDVIGIDGGGSTQPETSATRHEWTVKLDWVDADVFAGATSVDIRATLNGIGRVKYTVATLGQDEVPAAQFAGAVVASGTFDLGEPYTAVTITVDGLTDGTKHYVYLVAEEPGGAQVETVQELTPQLQVRHATHSFQTNAASNVTIGYYAYAPEDYYKSDEDFPLLVFFHGAGERGPGDTSQLRRVLTHGPPSLIESGWEFPFIVVSPQTEVDLGWDLRVMDEVVNLIQETHRVDRKRIYITGISMGGNATWNYITSFPDKVAAAIPIAGWGSTNRACNASDVPIWAFHGNADPTVDVSGTQRMIAALERCDPPARIPPIYTEYEGVGHNSWTRTYDNSATGGDIYEWLLTHENTAP